MKSKVERTKTILKWVLPLAVTIPVAAVIIYLLIWYGPDVIARHDIRNVTGSLRALRLQQARDAARGRLLTLGAGIFAAGALVFTARNSIYTQRTVQLTEQGQVTDRYTKAIEQLGSDKLDVRIGSIYALERVARDSARDHPTVMEVLAAFIREHSREPWPVSTSGPGSSNGTPETRAPRPDVQAAATVIGRRDSRYDVRAIDLRDADFTGADLDAANLTKSWLQYAELSNAVLNGANLTKANLSAANLVETFAVGTNFTDAILQDARLSGIFVDAILVKAFLQRADLSGAGLRDANFDQADLSAANLSHAVLRNASLRGVNLSHANLTGADLTDADLTGATWSEDQATPKGWFRDPGSGMLRRASAEAHDAGN